MGTGTGEGKVRRSSDGLCPPRSLRPSTSTVVSSRSPHYFFLSTQIRTNTHRQETRKSMDITRLKEGKGGGGGDATRVLESNVHLHVSFRIDR